MRDSTTQPVNAGSSINSRTSVGSPSSSLVCGTKPKSYGNVMPSASTLLNVYAPSSGSYANLLRLPFGVSITTRRLLLPVLKGSIRSGDFSLLGLDMSFGVHRSGCNNSRMPASRRMDVARSGKLLTSLRSLHEGTSSTGGNPLRSAIRMSAFMTAAFRGLWMHRKLPANPTRLQSAEWLHRVCIRGLEAIHLQRNVHGTPPTHGLIVSNHLTYLDILCYSAAVPCVFVSKAEVEQWPIFGTLCPLVGQRLRATP